MKCAQAYLMEETGSFSDSRELQDFLLRHKKQQAFAYACHALHLALFGSAEDWQKVRDEVAHMERGVPCRK